MSKITEILNNIETQNKVLYLNMILYSTGHNK